MWVIAFALAGLFAFACYFATPGAGLSSGLRPIWDLLKIAVVCSLFIVAVGLALVHRAERTVPPRRPVPAQLRETPTQDQLIQRGMSQLERSLGQ